MTTADIQTASNHDLVEWLCNARKTEAQALGHGKTAMNAQLVRLYKKELQNRNITVPSDDHIYEHGIFNGKGSA